MALALKRRIADRVFLTTGAFIGEHLDRRSAGLIRAWKTRRRLHREWARAAGVIAVSPQVGNDWLSTGAFPKERIHTPPPPVVGVDVRAASTSSVPHQWLEPEAPPVVLGVGRLHQNKGFHRLLDGFSRLLDSMDARLIILGKGEEQEMLQRQAEELGISDKMALPGFVDNPYSWIRAADVLVMTSVVEPFGFVLIEAMYLGTPYIADITPPGPRSIREVTGCGTLVHTDDPEALAKQIEAVVFNPPSAEDLHRAGSLFDARHSVPKYLELFGKNEHDALTSPYRPGWRDRAPS